MQDNPVPLLCATQHTKSLSFPKPNVLTFLSVQETILSGVRTDGAMHAALWIWDSLKMPRVADGHIPDRTNL